MSNNSDESITPTISETPAQATPESSDKKVRRFSVVPLIFAIIFGVAGAFLWITGTVDSRAREAENSKYTAAVQGTVSGIPFCDSDAENSCHIEYEYEVDGKTYTKSFDNIDALRLISNSNNIVRYDPNNPADAILPEDISYPADTMKKWEDQQKVTLAKELMGIAVLLLLDAFLGRYISTLREKLLNKR